MERVARELVARLPALRPERYEVIRPPSVLAFKAGHAWEQGVLPVAARSARLILSPANLAPLAGGRRNVVVIHDVAALRHPEAYGSVYVAYQRRLLPAIARRARLVITVSEFSKGEIVELLGADPAKVEVVPNGVGERFTPDADSEGARARYGLRKPYVLAVGTASARKNLSALDGARRALAERGIEVVVAGSGRGYLRGGAGQGLGYVPEDVLPGLYAGALALAMPSLHEGFGLPCLEAMASGTPVVAARRGALPETCGDAALLVEPDAFAEALIALAADDALRERLAEAGLERAAGFTWIGAAERTDALLGVLLQR